MWLVYATKDRSSFKLISHQLPGRLIGQSTLQINLERSTAQTTGSASSPQVPNVTDLFHRHIC